MWGHVQQVFQGMNLLSCFLLNTFLIFHFSMWFHRSVKADDWVLFAVSFILVSFLFLMFHFGEITAKDFFIIIFPVNDQ